MVPCSALKRISWHHRSFHFQGGAFPWDSRRRSLLSLFQRNPGLALHWGSLWLWDFGSSLSLVSLAICNTLTLKNSFVVSSWEEGRCSDLQRGRGAYVPNSTADCLAPNSFYCAAAVLYCSSCGSLLTFHSVLGTFSLSSLGLLSSLQLSQSLTPFLRHSQPHSQQNSYESIIFNTGTKGHAIKLNIISWGAVSAMGCQARLPSVLGEKRASWCPTYKTIYNNYFHQYLLIMSPEKCSPLELQANSAHLASLITRESSHAVVPWLWITDLGEGRVR